jgi:hypothetical protein
VAGGAKMSMDELTLRLPAGEIEFIEEYAKGRKLTVSELIEQYIRELQVSQKFEPHPDLKKVTGIIPQNLDVKAEYYQHLVEKHYRRAFGG